MSRFVAASAGAVVLSLPLVLLVVSQRRQIAWIEPTSMWDVLRAPYDGFFDGTNSVLVAIGWLLLVLGAAVRWLSTPACAAGGSDDRLTSTSLRLLVGGWLLLPGAVLLSVGTVVPLYNPSYLAISAPALALAVGVGWAAGGPKAASLAIAAGLVLAYQPWSFHHSPNAKSDMLDVVAHVRSVQDVDAVLFVEGDGWNTRQLGYAYPSVFEDMADITLDEPIETSDQFFGSSKPLSESMDSLAGVNRLIAIGNSPPSGRTDLQEDLNLLRDGGFHVSSSTMIGDWSLVVLER